MNKQRIDAERVLSFWHKVEFFESAELRDIGYGKGAIHYRSEELAEKPDCLPWLNPEHVRRAGITYRPDKAYHFKLYLGLFNRSQIFEVASKAYPEKTEAWVERSRNEGLTCALTVQVRENGTLDRESFEISTAPWALGALQEGLLDKVTLDAFHAAAEVFRGRLNTIMTVADNLKHEHNLPLMLSTFELIEMLKALEAWTAFQPQDDNSPAIVVQLFPGRRDANWERKNSESRQSFIPLEQLGTELVATSHSLPEARQAEVSDEQNEETINDIAILNSFFIRDLEAVIQHTREKGLVEGSPLARYLLGECDRHPDLLLPEGRSLLMRNLEPARMPLGRWPGEDAHFMSLMQQFAINTIDETLDETGLYSVNGPPGTGKTTMLRELVARNVVKRAEVLASLNSPETAFAEDIKVTIGDQLKTIKRLIPELTGFEMVVVSSNNAAVENVTRELPQLKALGATYHDIAYLKPVAQKLAANHRATKTNKDSVATLTADQDCWGLIATALGKRRNRNCFGNRVFFKPIKYCITDDEAGHYLTLIPALKALASGRETKQDFQSAQRAFKAARNEIDEIQQDLKRLQKFRLLEQEIAALQEKYGRDCRIAARLALWSSELNAKKVRLWPVGAYCLHRIVRKRVAAKCRSANLKIELSRQRLEAAERRLETERGVCAPLQERYADALLPSDALDPEAPEVQRTSFGHCEVLNQARAQLTVRAFELHQAWLVATYDDKKNTLWETLNSLMSVVNGSVNDRDAAMALWQILFMIVPVVSSTFASVANQFRALKEGELGWLFVDEAGQAPPQQAIGALWRAKRAVVVGDPLQIEPVFTVPPGLVEAMAVGEFDRDWYRWSPTVSSVQLVADQANPYGTHQIAEGLWVGSPLRVHRRCDEPMFSIANTIAYNDKMLHGDPNLSAEAGESRWFDVAGAVEGKHFVPDQATFVLEMLSHHLSREQAPPKVYIISPFKAVARGVKRHLELNLPAEYFGGKEKLSNWLRERVGTVHTFQGKEEDNVILVLGLSAEAPGAAEWASSKPNLLNVALTRAKKGVFVVGSADIWASKKYFSEASRKLSLHDI